MAIKLTKAQLGKLPKLGATDGTAPEAKIARVKFFGGGRWTWYAVEFDGADQFFGYVVSGLGEDCDEWGYFTLSELQAARVPIIVNGEQRGSVGLEVDRYWVPGVVPELQTKGGPNGPKGGGVDLTKLPKAFEKYEADIEKEFQEEKELGAKLRAGLAKEEAEAKGRHAPLTDQTAELMGAIKAHDSKATAAHNAQAAAAGPKPKARRMKITDEVTKEAPEVTKARAAFVAEKAKPPEAFGFDASELRAVALAIQGTKEAPEPMIVRFRAQKDLNGKRCDSLTLETLGDAGDELRITLSASASSALAFVVEASTLAEKIKGMERVTLRAHWGAPGRIDGVSIEQAGKAHAEISATEAPEPIRWPVDGAPRAIELRAIEVPLSHVAQAVGVDGERARMARIHVSHNADGWALTSTDGSRIHQGMISATLSGAAGLEPTSEGTLPGELATAWLELVQAFGVDASVSCVVNWHAGKACTLQVIAGALRFELLSGFEGHSFPNFQPTIPAESSLAWIQVSGLELERAATAVEGAWKGAATAERKAAALRVKSLPKGATAAQKDTVRARIASVAMTLGVSDSRLAITTASATDTDGNGSRYIEAPDFKAAQISSVASDKGVIASARAVVNAAFVGEALAHVLSNGDAALIGFVVGVDFAPIVVRLPSTNVSALIMPIASASNARCVMANGRGLPKSSAKPTAERKGKATKATKAGG